MKQLIILTAILFASVSSATAQISKTQADEIVSERLEKETQTYTFFDRDTIHTGFEVRTANGEILELNYRCWIYYVHYTNDTGLYLIVNESNGNLLEVRTSSNAKPEDIEQNENDTLQGTKWKLMGIVDTQTDILKELEPKDCDECYSFTFDTDSTAIGWITSNDLFVWLRPVVSIATFSKALGSDFYIEDAILFRNVIKTITSYELNKNELKFFYNDNKNYLLFKPRKL